jgi:hypothetical protein
MKTTNSCLLVVSLILACIPSALMQFAPISHRPYDDLPFVGGFVWLVIVVVYYRRVKTDRALWIFALAPIAFWPLAFVLLLYMGAVLGFGH